MHAPKNIAALGGLNPRGLWYPSIGYQGAAALSGISSSSDPTVRETTLSPKRTGAASEGPREKWVRAGDLGLMLKLPAAALIATLLPSASWERAAGTLDGMAAWLGNWGGRIERGTIAALVLGQGVAASPEAIGKALQRNCRFNQLCFIASWRPGGWSPEITITGTEHLHAALAAGRGAVLWVAPFVFAPLVAKRGLHQAGFAVHHLSRPNHGFSSTRFGVVVLNPIRTRIEDRYLAERITIPQSGETTAAVRTLARRLAANRIVSITFTFLGERQVEVPFLAGRLRSALGAPHLALRSGAPLHPVFALRTGPQSFSVEIAPALVAEADGTREQQLRALVEAYAAQMVQPVRLHPDQFLWQGGIVSSAVGEEMH
jgi:lauroyl/myristoyl acyltransferase